MDRISEDSLIYFLSHNCEFISDDSDIFSQNCEIKSKL